MRPSSYACLLALGCLLATAPASASPEFPIVIQNHLNLPDAFIPDCTLCHTSDAGGNGTVTRPFGKQGLARGLKAGDDGSLTTYLDASAAEKTDSDGDGVTDIDELKAGTDPNLAPGGVAPSFPEYGCATSPAPRSAPGGLAALLVAAGLVLSRRRARG